MKLASILPAPRPGRGTQVWQLLLYTQAIMSVLPNCVATLQSGTCHHVNLDFFFIFPFIYCLLIFWGAIRKHCIVFFVGVLKDAPIQTLTSITRWVQVTEGHPLWPQPKKKQHCGHLETWHTSVENNNHFFFPKLHLFNLAEDALWMIVLMDFRVYSLATVSLFLK